MDKKALIPTASLLIAAITVEAVAHHHEPEPHVEVPTLVVHTPILPPATGVRIQQLS